MHKTIGKRFNAGKIANVECRKNDSLEYIEIKGKCFLLIFLKQGSLTFEVGGEKKSFYAPTFICFDETENPVFLSKYQAEYFCIYFHPNFLSKNMSFRFLRSEKFKRFAQIHDIFMLKPFVDRSMDVPICESYVENITYSCIQMEKELQEQKDWYWSCRSRSYFMEIIIYLERMYEMFGYEIKTEQDKENKKTEDTRLNDAIVFIESNYMKDISLTQISNAAGINHVTLTDLSKELLGVTIMEFLMQYRVGVAKKHLAFTDIPIKEVADRSGFKTVQHFSRVFKKATGKTPAKFRDKAVDNRKKDEHLKENAELLEFAQA